MLEKVSPGKLDEIAYVSGMAGDKEIPLTEIWMEFSTPEVKHEIMEQRNLSKLDEYLQDEKVKLTWVHMDERNIAQAMSYCQSLFEKIVSHAGSLSMSEVSLKISEFHWWLYHVTPHYRGSAAITEMLIKTLFRLYGHNSPGWKKDVVPFAQAMVLPLSEFQENYRLMYDRDPFESGTAG